MADKIAAVGKEAAQRHNIKVPKAEREKPAQRNALARPVGHAPKMASFKERGRR